MAGEEKKRGIVFTWTVGLFVVCLGVTWLGFVVQTLWGWFLVPMGAPAITLSQAVGMDMIATLFGTGSARKFPGEDDDEHSKYLLRRLALAPFLALVVGWIFYFLETL
jgi:hypothetical protein